ELAGRAVAPASEDGVRVSLGAGRATTIAPSGMDEPARSPAPWATDDFAHFAAEMRSELRSLHRTVDALRAAAEASAPPGRPDEAEDLVRARLERAGLASATTERLVQDFRDERTRRPGVGFERFLRGSIEARLTPPRALEPGQVRLMVGAPGVGKTTTLAKLAARNEEGERDVTLVSLDHYRVGASEALRRYADLLESPFVEADSPAEILRLPARRAGHEILVDTAGRGREDGDSLVALEPLRAALVEALRVELVIDATSRADVARAQLDRFAALRPDRIVLTRIDECTGLAPVVDLLLDPHCPPAAWFGTGQRVPEDLETAEVGPLVRGVLGAAA
ncbi:MAG: hypothetical protein AAGC67_03435, partial [Myxococcota bacterium]